MARADPDPNVFPVETRFHKLAQRPGGVPREQAIAHAQAEVEEAKVGFDDWLDERFRELTMLFDAVKRGNAQADWIEVANLCSRQLRDVGTTVGFELLSFVADSLCEVLDAAQASGEHNIESIACHIDSLKLIQNRSYRRLKPEQVPELTEGLQRAAKQAAT
jgi:hypothetical protein